MSDIQGPASQTGAGQAPNDASDALSPAMAAVLEFTSDDPASVAPGGGSELRYLTSKDAYFWAAVAVALAQADLEPQMNASDPGSPVSYFPPHLQAIDVAAALNAAIISRADAIRNHYSSSRRLRFHANPAGVFLVEEPRGEMAIERALGLVVVVFLNSLRHRARVGIEDVNNALHDVRGAVEELERRDLVVDPILEVGLGAAVLGLVPFSFTHKTKNGKLAHLKLQAALWKYERKRARDEVETNVTFEAARLAKILKGKLVELFHDVVGGRREPPDPPEQASA